MLRRVRYVVPAMLLASQAHASGTLVDFSSTISDIASAQGSIILALVALAGVGLIIKAIRKAG